MKIHHDYFLNMVSKTFHHIFNIVQILLSTEDSNSNTWRLEVIQNHPTSFKFLSYKLSYDNKCLHKGEQSVSKQDQYVWWRKLKRMTSQANSGLESAPYTNLWRLKWTAAMHGKWLNGQPVGWLSYKQSACKEYVSGASHVQCHTIDCKVMSDRCNRQASMAIPAN